MGSMFAPNVPERAPATPPTSSDPALQAAQRNALSQQGSMYGRAQTLLTTGAGDTSAPSVAKKSLLGQ